MSDLFENHIVGFLTRRLIFVVAFEHPSQQFVSDVGTEPRI